MKIATHYVENWNGKPIMRLNAIERYFKNALYNTKQDNENKLSRFCSICIGPENNRAAVAPNGDLYACQEMPSNEGSTSPFWIGSIYTGIDTERQNNIFQACRPFIQQGDMPCEQCSAYYFCYGGCASQNYLSTNHIRHCSHEYCELLRQTT